MPVDSQLQVRDYLNPSINLAASPTTAAPQLLAYEPVWQAMKDFTRTRTADTPDELWLLEHAPVFTLGKAADEAHVIDAGDIPMVRVDRGGQVTYHGPGQIMAYALINLSRRNLGVRALVECLERTVIDVLAAYGVEAYGDRKAPGVYVNKKKIAALGLRVSRGCSYHGLCFNFDFDTAPFLGINPCGFPELEVTQLQQEVAVLPDKKALAKQLVEALCVQLAYDDVRYDYSTWGR
ncbi:lipoyl(octanoyl) transferase LipB [Pseudomonadales bacterium]|nr:lipoyl(octanoyl) transferase LipB [Pseudomonadales bacterium]